MTKPIARDPIYRRRRFEAEIIELCVRWYITYRLSYRDLVAMMAERGLPVSHTTILRWVIRYVPEFEKRWSRRAREVHSSWRVDETYISVRGKWHYLYRAVDKRGKTVDFLLRPDRGIAAAQAFFRKSIGHISCRQCTRTVPRWLPSCARPQSSFRASRCVLIICCMIAISAAADMPSMSTPQTASSGPSSFQGLLMTMSP